MTDPLSAGLAKTVLVDRTGHVTAPWLRYLAQRPASSGSSGTSDGTALLATENLGDLLDVAAARTHLGLGALATQSTVSAAQVVGLTDDLAALTTLGDTLATLITEFDALQVDVGDLLLAWVPASATQDGYLTATDWASFDARLAPANNLSDVANATTARTNLGLGALAILSAVSLTTQATGTLQVGQLPTFTGDVTNSGLALTIANDAVTYAKLQNVTDARLLGRSAGSAGDAQELTVGSGLSLSGGVLSAAGSGLPWTTVTGTSQAMVANNGYVANNASLVTLTLPASAAVGDLLEVLGKGAGGWRIAQQAGQTIYDGVTGTATTTGTAGHVDSTTQYASLRLRCLTANTDFVIT